MDIGDVIDSVRARERTLTVFAPDAALADALDAHFASQNVSVVHEGIPEGESPSVVVSRGGRIRARVDASSVATFVDDDPSVKRVGEDAPYRELVEAVDDTTFRAYDIDSMLHASREIEDRAWRRGAGRLVAGFQSAASFDAQRHTYEVLASGDIDAHVFAPDGVAESPAGVTVHESTGDVADAWFVAYDGGGANRQKCALLAEEREPRQFYGVLTYRPSLVDDAFAALGFPTDSSTEPDHTARD